MRITILSLLIGIFLTSCTDLDMNPLSYGSTENWYSDQSEFEMAVNGLYKSDLWVNGDYFGGYPFFDEWTDDYTRRNETWPVTNATINGQWPVLEVCWTYRYRAIAQANTIVASLDKAKDHIDQSLIEKYEAHARFVRAAQYSWLISYFGDVIFSTTVMDLDESFTMAKTPKADILKSIYGDFDYAVAHLPESYGSSEFKWATKGAALAFKARIALYNQDWKTAGDAAKACMDLGRYELYDDFGKLFLSKTKNTKEGVFVIPRSLQLGSASIDCIDVISRNASGRGWLTPSWELFCSFLCTDGLPIDESPRFNPREPFKNRDPRCTATIVEFQTPFLGYMYQPHPDSVTCYNFNSGKYQKNNDSRTINAYSSFNGLLWKKGVDEDWSDNQQADPDNLLMRYADVLLMYAEAKIELGEIDESVLRAINQVRARAYQSDVAETSSYPAVTTTDKNQLRQTVRIERRMEFAFEELRYMDLIRWKLAEKALNKNVYGMLDVADLRTKVVEPGLWFFPEIPEIDEDGVADFSGMYSKGLIKLLAERKFDASKQYVWPIPTKEILINPNLRQNTGY